MKPFEHRGKFIIVKNSQIITPGDVKVPRASTGRGRITFDECWTGSGWTSNSNFGMKFETLALASSFMEENGQELEASLV